MEGERKMRKTWLLLLSIAVLGMCGCGVKEIVGDPVQAYMTIIEKLENPASFMQDDNMKYIAIDTRNMIGLADKKDKERLLCLLADTYEAELLDKNEVQLARSGYLNENQFEDGVLFKIKEEDFNDYEKSPVALEVQEWGRGMETNLLKRVVLEVKDGIWEIVEISDLAEKKIR